LKILFLPLLLLNHVSIFLMKYVQILEVMASRGIFGCDLLVRYHVQNFDFLI
jgi:hypothetical protein